MLIKQIDSDAEKGNITRTILEALPDWFGIPQAREEYIADRLKKTNTVAISLGGRFGRNSRKGDGNVR